MTIQEQIKLTAARQFYRYISNGTTPTSKHKNYKEWFKDKFKDDFDQYVEKMKNEK